MNGTLWIILRKKLCYRVLRYFILLTFLLSPFIGGCIPHNDWDMQPGAGDPEIQAILRDVSCRYNIVGMGAGIVRAAGEPNIAVVGWNKAGEETPIGLNDLWNLGSCSKAMTATLAAKLVEEGKLHWHTTLADVFPELAKKFNPAKQSITLEQLLSHRSGLPGVQSLFLRVFNLFRDPTEQRLAVLRHFRKAKLVGPPGAQYSYTNSGYIVAGAMIEQLTNQPFEEMMRTCLFAPLDMVSPEYEGTHLFGENGVIWSHRSSGRPVPRWIASFGDPAYRRPAGCVRCNLSDWARFIRHHLIGETGDSDYLKAESYRELHRSRDDNYALGWVVLQRDWGDGTVLMHTGSNGWNTCLVWIAPRKRFAVFACANKGKCHAALDEVAAQLIDQICGTNLISNSKGKTREK